MLYFNAIVIVHVNKPSVQESMLFPFLSCMPPQYMGKTRVRKESEACIFSLALSLSLSRILHWLISVTLIEAGVIWEKGTSIEIIPP